MSWGDVVAASEALAQAERPIEPQVGDLLDHPALGPLEVLDMEPTRLVVRDKAGKWRKLLRAVLEFRLTGERGGRRVLRVHVRPIPSPGSASS